MSSFQTALLSFAETIVGLYLYAMILRFLLELLRVDFRNPVVQTMVFITNPPLQIMRRFIPRLYGINLAAVVLIWVISLLKLTLQLWAGDHSFNWSGALMLSFANSLDTIVWVFLLTVLVRVVLSWVAPASNHPAARVIYALSEPVMAPFRRILPSLGGLDLSPILLLFAFRLLQQLLLTPLTNFAAGLLQ